jgi:hypothetical protein
MLGIAIFAAGLSTYFCIVILLKIVNKEGYLLFVIYKLGLGDGLLGSPHLEPPVEKRGQIPLARNYT